MGIGSHRFQNQPHFFQLFPGRGHGNGQNPGGIGRQHAPVLFLGFVILGRGQNPEIRIAFPHGRYVVQTHPVEQTMAGFKQNPIEIV